MARQRSEEKARHFISIRMPLLETRSNRTAVPCELPVQRRPSRLRRSWASLKAAASDRAELPPGTMGGGSKSPPFTLRLGAAERAKEMCRFFVGHGTGCEGGAERGACRPAAENASFKLAKSLNQRRNGADCQKAAVGGMILPYAEEGTQ